MLHWHHSYMAVQADQLQAQSHASTRLHACNCNPQLATQLLITPANIDKEPSSRPLHYEVQNYDTQTIKDAT